MELHLQVLIEFSQWFLCVHRIAVLKKSLFILMTLCTDLKVIEISSNLNSNPTFFDSLKKVDWCAGTCPSRLDINLKISISSNFYLQYTSLFAKTLTVTISFVSANIDISN